MHWIMPQRTDSAVTWWDWQQKQPKTYQTTKSPYLNLAEQGTGKNKQKKKDTSAHWAFSKANPNGYQCHWGSLCCFLYQTVARTHNSLHVGNLKAIRQQHLLVAHHWPRQDFSCWTRRECHWQKPLCFDIVSALRQHQTFHLQPAY